MPFTVTMPKLSPTMVSGTLVKWHKKEGDRVESGDLLIEVATDKATVEHNALDEGFLRKILVKEGASATINQPIAIFTEKAGESIEGYMPQGVAPSPSKTEEKISATTSEKAPSRTHTPTAPMQQPHFTPEPPLENYEFPFPTGSQ